MRELEDPLKRPAFFKKGHVMIRFFTIYLVTNTVNGKKYVGVTGKQPSRKRWVQHLAQARRGCDFLLHQAIRKYGAGAFEFEELAHAYSRKDAHSVEVALIRLFATYGFENHNYNMTAGGDGVSREWSDEERAKSSKRIKEGMTSEVRARISAAMKGKPSWAKGRKRTASHAANIAKARTDIYLTHEGESLSIKEWSARTGIDRGAIHGRVFRLGWTIERALTEAAKPRWTPEMIALLGTMPDSRVAKILKKPEGTVAATRYWHGIQAWRRLSKHGTRAIIKCKGCGVDVAVQPSMTARYKYCVKCSPIKNRKGSTIVSC